MVVGLEQQPVHDAAAGAALALAAWASWSLTAGSRWLAPGWEGSLETYLSLSLTCCAGVAVLGARRPGGEAWHFVVAGLLAVLLLPVLIDRLRQHRPGPLQLHEAQWFFLGTLLLVSVGNYLPTRLGVGAGVCGFGLALEVLRLGGATLPGPLLEAGALGLAASPWLALLACGWPLARPVRAGSDLADVPRSLWSLVGINVREQFNRAAANAGWRLALGWHGEYALEAGMCPEPELGPGHAAGRPEVLRYGGGSRSRRWAHGVMALKHRQKPPGPPMPPPPPLLPGPWNPPGVAAFFSLSFLSLPLLMPPWDIRADCCSVYRPGPS